MRRPGMVPVSVRSSLPEFQNYSIESVLAGLLLTWTEFLALCDIQLEAPDYYIKGSNGTKATLNDKVEDYVNTFRRKQKIYFVTLERVAAIVETSKGQKSATSASEDSNSAKMADKNKPSGSKRLKLMDEDKRKRNHRKTATESLEKIALNVVGPQQEQDQVETGQSQPQAVAAKRGAGKKRDSVKSRSATPPNTDKTDGDGTSASPDSPASLTTQGTVGMPSTSGKLKRLSTDHNQVKAITPASSSVGGIKRGRKPRATRTVSSRRSTKESINTLVSHESNEEDSSDSDDEEEPSKEKKKALKQNVLKYLTDKVSPRSFLRLQDELMTLRDQEKYFKVTSVVPMTAGMMEQAFCRKLTE